MENNPKEQKGSWYDATWARILIAVVLGRIIQANFFPEIGAVIIIPLTVVVVYLIWEGIALIIGKEAHEPNPVAASHVPLWKKIATLSGGALAFVFAFILMEGAFDQPSAANVHLASEDNQEFLRREVESTNGSLPMMVDEETRLDTVYASPDGKLNYRYTLVNYKGSEIDFPSIRDEIEEYALNGYCTHPEIQGFRDRDIPLVYHYLGSDGAFIGSFEANNRGCI
jgi:hypothetical protein